jgi:hypothetical protein
MLGNLGHSMPWALTFVRVEAQWAARGNMLNHMKQNVETCASILARVDDQCTHMGKHCGQPGTHNPALSIDLHEDRSPGLPHRNMLDNV